MCVYLECSNGHYASRFQQNNVVGDHFDEEYDKPDMNADVTYSVWCEQSNGSGLNLAPPHQSTAFCLLALPLNSEQPVCTSKNDLEVVLLYCACAIT